MKAQSSHLLTFLGGRKQFQIPIYQRTYSWGRTHCEKLLEDIITAGENKKSEAYFIGSVVYFQPEIVTTTGVPKYLVIDGQQRLTTITLLLTAIREFIKNNADFSLEEMSSEEIQDSYLFNAHKKDEDKFKLLLTKKDKDALIKILDRVPFDGSISRRVYENYNYFSEEIKFENIQKIFNGIQKLIIVDTVLEPGKDNAQLIFESLNSTGLNLSQADLIRNFIIMGQSKDVQEEIYHKSWYPMEQLFGDNIGKMTNFFRDYLTINTNEIPNYDKVYESFKSYINRLENFNIEDKVKEFLKIAGYYTNFTLNKETDSDLKSVFNDLKKLKVDVSYPLVLILYIDFKDELITKEEFISMLRMIESYVFRRAICEVPTNSMNKVFSVFCKDIKGDDYINSFRATFHLLKGYKRFPKNEEFIESLKKKSISSRLSYFLGKLENHGRKEKVKVEEYTIEHIMPQTLSPEWKDELGSEWERIHEQKLHTIGNLTLTGYNSEMSNKSFKEKLESSKGFLNSPLKLNESVRSKKKWNEISILEREKELIDKAVEVFQDFPINEDTLKKYRELTKKYDKKEEYDIKQFEMSDEIFSLFQKLNQRILNLDPQIFKEVKKRYIAYKIDTNVVRIIPRKEKKLWLCISMDIDQIYDPKALCYERKHGKTKTRISVSKESDIEYAMDIVAQSLEDELD